MNPTARLSATFLLGVMLCAGVVVPAREAAAAGTTSGPGATVSLPFESANLNIFLRVTVGESPLWFLLDTGCKSTLINLDLAKSLGLGLGDSVAVGGGGTNPVMGYFLPNSPFGVVGLPGFSQPLFLALPLGDLAQRSGHELAGVLGYDFIRQFVVEIDYVARTVVLHDTTTYEYRGGGETFPITFNAAAHPMMRAEIVDRGGSSIEGTFVLDLGSGAGVILNRPFVEEHHLLQGRHTVPWIEGRGIGGQIPGSVGRLKGLKLGRFLIPQPVTVFSHAENGPFASAEAQGNIGAVILERFKVILDYHRGWITLEPNAKFAEPMEYNPSGLSLVEAGVGHGPHLIAAIADGSPALAAGLQVGDTLVAVNGRPAADFSLSDIRLLFTRAKTCSLAVRGKRGPVQVTLRLRSPI